MTWLNLLSLFGCAVLAVLAWIFGGCRRPVPWRTTLGSGLLMIALGIIVFWVPQTRRLLVAVNSLVLVVLDAGSAGALFLFGPLALNAGQTTDAGAASIGFVFAAQALPLVVFFAALMALLYHLKIVQPVVRALSRLLHGTLRLSGAEALAGASNVFFGLESATTIRPYLERMTRSELLTVLTCCMATVASTTLALYVRMLQDVFPQIAGHLISASVLSIPAAVLTSKLLLPENETPETLGRVPPIHETRRRGNAMAALSVGAWDGLKLAAGIATLLVAVLGVVALLDVVLNRATAPFADQLGGPLDLRRMLGWIFTPPAWLLGIEAADLTAAGRLLGGRLVLTEIPAYQELAVLARNGEISSRSLLVVSYALCGFTHVASMGIFVGGIAALAPSRRDDLAALGPRALLAATLTTLMTGAVAGLLFHGQRGILGL